MDVRRATLAALTAGFLLLSAPCRAQSTRPEDLAQGKIIITPRDAPDPHFANSVILLAHYDQSGALGLMLHYKSNLTIQKALSGLKGAEKRTDPVFVGGPVELPVVFALTRSKPAPQGASLVAGNLYLMTSRQSIGAALAEAIPAADLRVFIGYTGWGPGQLQREVSRSGWYIFDYDEGIVFDDHPETLWDRLIVRTERRLATNSPRPAPTRPSPAPGMAASAHSRQSGEGPRALYTRVTFSAWRPFGPCLTSNSTAAPSSRLR